MRRRLVSAAAVLGIAACQPAAKAPPPPVAPEVYPAPVSWWPHGVADGVIGAGPVAVPLHGVAIAAAPGVTGGPLTMTELVGSADGDGAAEAALSGREVAAPAIDLIDVDAGVVRWRNRSTGVAAVAIVGDAVFAAGGSKVIVLDRGTGVERARYDARWRGVGWRRDGQGGREALAALQIGGAKAATGANARGETAATIAIWQRGQLGDARALPDGAIVEAIAAVCADGDRVWLAAWRDGRLERWDEDGGRYAVTWAVAAPQVVRIDCTAAPVLVSGGGPRAVRAIDPARGAVVGGPVMAADFWPARRGGDAVELATPAGIEARDRRLGAPARGEDLVIDQWMAGRGARRLVRGADGGPWLLDARGARPLAAPVGDPIVVAGEQAMIAGPWRWPLVTQAPQPARFLWPPPDDDGVAGARPPAPIVRLAAPLVGDPPRVDLPAVQPPGPAVAAEAGAWAVGAVAFDPADPERMYVVVIEERPTASVGAGIAAFDLHVDRFRWIAPAACPPGAPIAIAVTGDVIACGARGAQPGHGAVRASGTRDGVARWTWHGPTVDAVLAAGDAIAIVVGSETIVVDAATGDVRARWRSSDGFSPRLALTAPGGEVEATVLERGALVTRTARLGFSPARAVAVGGRAATVFALGDAVAASLIDGSLYFLAPRRAAGVLATAWHPRGDRMFAFATNPLGDAIVVGVDPDGVPRVAVALPDVALQVVGARAAVPGAPIALAAIGGRVIALDAEGRARAVAAFTDVAAPASFATVVDGEPVVGVVLAKPLRVMRLTLE